MSEDLTKKLPMSDSDKTILTAVQNLDIFVRGAIDNLVTWISSIDSRLQRLDQKVEQRLHDTRPIWHKVVADIGQLQTGQQELHAEVRELSGTIRDVNRDQTVFNDAIRKVHLDFHNIDERLHRLEVNRNPPSNSQT